MECASNAQYIFLLNDENVPLYMASTWSGR